MMSASTRKIVYSPQAEQAMAEVCDVVLDLPGGACLQDHAEALADVELLFSSWGGPVLSSETLALLPRLRAVLYAAGSIRRIATDAFWEKDIPICSAAPLNAIPVAEYAFAQVILCLKQSYHLARQTREAKTYANHSAISAPLGSYGAVVGLVSLGEIARQLLVRLRTLDVRVQVYDPYLSAKEAKELGVEQVDLKTLFASSDVVSIHTPWLPETEGLISGELIASMKQGASLINTARGAVIDEIAMGQVLAARQDLQAVIDVTYPEPPPPDSPLYTLANVFFTPHIAGSLDRECARMGDAMVEEARRLLKSEPLHLRVTPEAYARMA